jgi:hypothetical protein
MYSGLKAYHRWLGGYQNLSTLQNFRLISTSYAQNRWIRWVGGYFKEDRREKRKAQSKGEHTDMLIIFRLSIYIFLFYLLKRYPLPPYSPSILDQIKRIRRKGRPKRWPKEQSKTK